MVSLRPFTKGSSHDQTYNTLSDERHLALQETALKKRKSITSLIEEMRGFLRDQNAARGKEAGSEGAQENRPLLGTGHRLGRGRNPDGKGPLKPPPGVIDTNVLVSGLITADERSPVCLILDAMLAGRVAFLLFSADLFTSTWPMWRSTASGGKPGMTRTPPPIPVTTISGGCSGRNRAACW